MLVLAGLLVVVSAVALVVKQSDDRAAAAEVARRFATFEPTTVPTMRPVAVTVISDDLAAPASTGTPVPQWPMLVQQDLGQRVVSLTTSGSGYTTRPLTSLFGGTFVARASQAAPSSRVVLIMGGNNDQRATRVQLLRASSEAITAAQQRAPDATIVVVGPASPGRDAPDSLLAVRNALRESATRGEARFVDPIAQGWLNDRTGYLAADERSLTELGQREMATRIDAVLRPLL